MEKYIRQNHWFDNECATVTERKKRTYLKVQARRTKRNVKKCNTRRREEKQVYEKKEDVHQ